MKRTALKRKPARRKPGDTDTEYVAWVREQPCSVPDCVPQKLKLLSGHTEAHHAGDHGLAQRPPDRTCIPLCIWHHREGGDSAHVLGRRFWGAHGLERDALIAHLNARYDAGNSTS